MDKGVKEAISTKYLLYSKMIYQTCMIYLKNRQDAEDAVQETFYKLMLRSKSFFDLSHERRWLFCVAKNVCKNMLKAKRRSEVAYDDIYEKTVFNDADKEILDCVYSLKYKYRDVVMLYYFKENNVKEIASILGIGTSAVKMRLKRAREILKIEMEESL